MRKAASVAAGFFSIATPLLKTRAKARVVLAPLRDLLFRKDTPPEICLILTHIFFWTEMDQRSNGSMIK
jgi:hypothetical protein